MSLHALGENMKPKVAIIGGTGICDPSLLSNVQEKVISTPYGGARVYIGDWAEEGVAFLPRHVSIKGKGHKHYLSPHKINYRANIWALKALNIQRIIGTSATGSLNPKMKPGSVAILAQFIDFTKSRPSTFYEEETVYHIDMTEPYCPEIRKVLYQSAKEEVEFCFPSATYVCTEGPRFETPAEISACKTLGADLVGMTNVPEVVLARELAICYASIAIVTNMAAGIAEGKLSTTEVEEMMEFMTPKLETILKTTLDKLPQTRSCACQDALKGAQM